MTLWDERLEDLKEIAGQAVERAHELEQTGWPDGDVRERAESVMTYAQEVIDRSDGALVPGVVVDGVAGALTSFINGPEVLASEADNWLDTLLLKLESFPPAKGRDVEQSARRTAQALARSARARLGDVARKTDQLQSEIDGLGTEIESRRGELAELVEQRVAGVDARVTELQDAAERHVRTVEALSTEQSEAFRKAQDERTEEFRERVQDFEAETNEARSGLVDQGQTLIADLEGMKTRGGKLVGAIGIAGTAERYEEEFEEQRTAANRWRWMTIAVGVLAAAVAVWAAFENDSTKAGAKVAIAILVGGVGFYTARQSARHRHREEHARQLQLDLTAFPVFIESLPPEAQNEATEEMVFRSFRGALPEPLVDDEAGLGVGSAFRPRRKPKVDESQE
jgi:uncharacterized protein YoxC